MNNVGWMIGTDTHHARSDAERWAGDFHIFKATEGSTFIDPKFKEMYALWNKTQIYPYPIGLYHFLSIKSNIKKQIDFFIDTIEYARGKVMIILDYEGDFAKADSDGAMLNGALENLDYLTGGAQLVVYMDKSNAKKIISKTRIHKRENICLWLADYKGDYKECWKPIMRQVCTSPCDIDVFYGSEISWHEIARSWN